MHTLSRFHGSLQIASGVQDRSCYFRPKADYCTHHFEVGQDHVKVVPLSYLQYPHRIVTLFSIR
jgi:hypothetical protein